MYVDAQLMYSDAQALTATAVSTNIVDHGADRDMGTGEPLAVVVLVDVALDGTTGDETYAVQVQTDDNSSFSSASSVGGSVSLTRGAAAGTKYVIPLPADTAIERYTRLNYTLGGTSPTGTVTAYLTPMSMIQGSNLYADAITIG
jgi:hypothetical protein